MKGWDLARDYRLSSLPGSVPTHHWTKTGMSAIPCVRSEMYIGVDVVCVVLTNLHLMHQP